MAYENMADTIISEWLNDKILLQPKSYILKLGSSIIKKPCVACDKQNRSKMSITLVPWLARLAIRNIILKFHVI